MCVYSNVVDGCSIEFRYSIDYLYPSYKITIVMCHI